MKIVILTADHIYANLVVKSLLRDYKSDIKLVVVSKVILHNTSLISSLIKYYRVSGWYYFLAQTTKLQIYKLLSLISKNSEGKFFSFKKILDKNRLSYESNVNSKDFIKVIKHKEPDLIVSVFFNQILSEDLIEIAKKGVINIHPAFLPNYKGVSPVFWSLANNEKYAGISVHFVNKGIDTGGIIARKKIKISNSDSEDSLYFKLANLGVSLLVRTIHDISKGKVKTTDNSKGSYFSLPSKKAVEKFKRQGRNFFNLKEYIFK